MKECAGPAGIVRSIYLSEEERLQCYVRTNKIFKVEGWTKQSEHGNMSFTKAILQNFSFVVMLAAREDQSATSVPFTKRLT